MRQHKTLMNAQRNLAHFVNYRRGMKKHIEILFIKVAIWILMGRNVTRCLVVSRRDNNDMWYMAERLEAIVQRMGEEYRAAQ